MGRDIAPFGKHDLDLSSLQVLADQLAQRLGANIRYGYQEWFSIKDGVLSEGSYDNIYLGESRIPGAWDTFTLIQDNYQRAMLYEQYGEQLAGQPMVRNDPSLMANIRDGAKNKWFELNKEWGNEWAWIFPDMINLEFDYFSRWGALWEVLSSPSDTFNHDHLNEWRGRNNYRIKQMGGSDMIYFCDQGTPGSDSIDTSQTWEAVKEELFKNYQNRIVLVSKAVSDYRKSGQLLDFDMFNDDWPVAYYDDFADL